jgi:hypothetical protein
MGSLALRVRERTRFTKQLNSASAGKGEAREGGQ